MKIRRVKSKGLVFSRLPAAQLRLLQQLPLHADPAGSATAEERLYQSPVKLPLDEADDDLVNDWNEHVLPDLRGDFARQIDCVTADLNQARRESRPRRANSSSLRETEPENEPEFVEVAGESYELVIPSDHVDAWYGALNQARLVMQARYKFPEMENLAAIVALLASENLKPYLTARFYTEIQAALLELGMDAD